MVKKYQKPDNRGEISCKKKNLSQTKEIPDLFNIIQSSLTLITLREDNLNLTTLANNSILFMHLKHMDI